MREDDAQGCREGAHRSCLGCRCCCHRAEGRPWGAGWHALGAVAGDAAPIQPMVWMDEALCAEIGPEIFFPARRTQETNAAAIAMCRKCDVAQQCLAFAIDVEATDGIWGGVRNPSLWRARSLRASRHDNRAANPQPQKGN